MERWRPYNWETYVLAHLMPACSNSFCNMMLVPHLQKSQTWSKSQICVCSIDILHLHCSGHLLEQDAHLKQCKCRMSYRMEHTTSSHSVLWCMQMRKNWRANMTKGIIFLQVLGAQFVAALAAAFHLQTSRVIVDEYRETRDLEDSPTCLEYECSTRRSSSASSSSVYSSWSNTTLSSPRSAMIQPTFRSVQVENRLKIMKLAWCLTDLQAGVQT